MAAHFVAEEDAQIVAMMKREGAIPVVRGSCPQLVWMGHTTNKIFGCGKNPYNPDRTVSGSSGGDGGLVSARCVPFALGTDIGGSVRAPAACNGIIGFKPTSQRSTQGGVVTSLLGYRAPQNAVISCAGPLCNSVDDVHKYLKCLWSEDFLRRNLQIPPLLFNSEVYNKTKDKKLRLGYLVFKTSTGENELGLENLPLSKASKRAMTMTIDKLRE